MRIGAFPVRCKEALFQDPLGADKEFKEGRVTNGVLSMPIPMGIPGQSGTFGSHSGDAAALNTGMPHFNTLRDVPISVRLWLLIVLNSSLALVLTGAGSLLYQRYAQRSAAVQEIEAQASVLSESMSAALTFDDRKAAHENLSALRGDSHIVEAAVYGQRGVGFAVYTRGSVPGAPAPPLRRDGVYFEGDDLLAFQPVRLQGERVGTIFLRSTTDVTTQLHRYIAIMLAVLMLSLGIALLLSSGVQRTIALPVRQLSAAARRVTAEKDYSVRASVHSGAELGVLVDSFNQMLAEIERRDRAQHAAEESLRESELRYALAARGANDGLWDWKLTRNEIYFSPRWTQMIGYDEGEIAPDPNEWFGRIHSSDVARVQAELMAHQNGATSEFSSEYRMRHRNGSFIWMLSRGAVVRDDSGVAVRMAGSQTDITAGKVADPLTGLPNRLYFLDRLEDAIGKRTADGIGFAVLFIDLDRFKLVNDSLGHAAGDELLSGIAGRLKHGVRGAAQEWGRSVVARLGGDEFAVLLADIHEITAAKTVAERLLSDLSAPFQIAGRQVFGMVSIGVAPGTSAETPEELLRNADTAMYHAKAKGKGRAEVYDEKMRDRARARLEIEIDLRKAIELNQLVVFYQPQVSLLSGRVVGYEALVRWQHPVRGLIPPSEFIPIAEETDLIIPLGRMVLREACRQMAEWHATFQTDPPLSISVNVSVRQLTGTNLVAEVMSTLAETGLPAASLRLEVTESSVMANTEAAIEVLRQLKDLGVGLEIDDFGTGYSSLSYLNRLPFDTVKIDRSFVKELQIKGEAAEIVRTILDLASSMNMNVVAEGVETDEQLAALTEMGCEYGQGYYFARPADRNVTQALIGERHALRRAFARLEACQPTAEDRPASGRVSDRHLSTLAEIAPENYVQK